MSDLVTRLGAWHRPSETITGDVALYLEAADRIGALEMALVELSQTNGSHSDGGRRKYAGDPRANGSAPGAEGATDRRQDQRSIQAGDWLLSGQPRE
jgi:hypothetical protein